MFSRKPNCSYNCLIGMALKSSDTGKLPVGEIYRFFEREFPYFLTATEPWKNSLRHSLSLGHFFRKYNIDRMQTKKGHLWEVEPHKAPELDKEMSMFLAKGIPDNLPSTSQLSILRLQMTQLYLDSIKNTPSSSSYSSSLISPQRSRYSQRNTEFSDMRNLSGTMMLTPDSVSLQNFVPGQTDVNDSSPNFTIPSSHVASYYTHDRQKMTRSMFSSLRNRNATPSTSSPTPSQSSSANWERDTPTSEISRFLNKQQFGVPSLLPHVSEEAIQLIQFCNHCSFELGPTTHISAQNEPGLSPSDQCTSGQNFACIAQSNICDCTNTFHDAEDEDNRYYPFITKPTGDHNLALSQINNSGSLYMEPGSPRELVIKKYPRGRRMKSSLSMSLDNAIRPVVHDWNAWWKKEYIQCALSDEALINSIECPCDDNSNNTTFKEDPQRSRNTLTQDSTSKISNPSFLTLTKDGNWISPLPSTQSKECREGKTSINTRNKKESNKGKGEADKRYHDRQDISPEVTTPTNSPVNHRDKMMSTRNKVIRVYTSLCLIVSIPFRKLITERQLKKYCGEGGKYRIGIP